MALATQQSPKLITLLPKLTSQTADTAFKISSPLARRCEAAPTARHCRLHTTSTFRSTNPSRLPKASYNITRQACLRVQGYMGFLGSGAALRILLPILYDTTAKRLAMRLEMIVRTTSHQALTTTQTFHVATTAWLARALRRRGRGGLRKGRGRDLWC
jgi:hypothetical protein